MKLFVICDFREWNFADIFRITGNEYKMTEITYRKVPKFSDAKKLCCNLPKILTKRPNLKVFCQNDANGIANSEDPDQQSDLGLHCLPRPICPKI